MALSPREILQHMEVPSRGAGHPWPGARGIYILGSLEPVRISLYSQHVRALNLIYALVCEDRIRKDTRVAIIGAGPAGLAAARAASHFGAKCYVFDKSERPMDVFCPGGKGNSRRYVHPSIENWPFPGSENNKASRLPFPQWTAGTPKHVADQIIKDFELNAASVDLHVSVSAKISDSGGQWTIDYESEKWSWHQTERPERCGDRLKEIKVLIFAIGFGTDNVTERATGYWDDDSGVWTEIRLHGGSLLVSGDGDGAIIEAVNAAVGPKVTHEELTKTVLGVKDEKLLDELINIERRITRQDLTGDQLKKAYDAIEERFKAKSTDDNQNPLTKIDEKLKSLRDGRSPVTLLTPAESPYNPRAFAVNRFLLWRFISIGRIAHRKGRVVKPVPSLCGEKGSAVAVPSIWPPLSETSITQQRNDEYMWRIHRHGTVKSLQTDYPQLYDLCKRVLQPKNELDQTRVPAWPDNFFKGITATKPAPRRAEGSGPDYNITVRHGHEFAKFNSISCIETFSPFTPDNQSAGLWIRCKTEIMFDVETIPANGFSLEHRLTPTNPFRLLLTLNQPTLLKRRSLAGDPPWAVAYGFSPKCKEKVSVVLDGVPATAFSFRDATGFPIFGDMMVKKLHWRGIFRDMSPHVVVKEGTHGATVLEYRSPIRRMDYEDGEESATEGRDAALVNEERYIDLVRKDGHYTGNVTWRPEKPGADSYLPPGYFYGAQWSFIQPCPAGDATLPKAARAEEAAEIAPGRK